MLVTAIPDDEHTLAVVHDKKKRMPRWVEGLLWATVTAVLTLGTAGLLSGDQRDLARRVDSNAAIAAKKATAAAIAAQEASLRNRFEILVNRCLIISDAGNSPRPMEVLHECRVRVGAKLDYTPPKGDDASQQQ